MIAPVRAKFIALPVDRDFLDARQTVRQCHRPRRSQVRRPASCPILLHGGPVYDRSAAV